MLFFSLAIKLSKCMLFIMKKSKNNSQYFAIVAVESSGDRIGAGVVKEIKKLNKQASFIGIGATNLQNCGVELVADIASISAIGVLDPFLKIKKWLSVYASFRLECKKRAVKAVILVDGFDFNIRLARALYDEGVKVMWYVGPKIWAWRKNRLELFKTRVHLTALLFPFEKPLYDAAKIPAFAAGHPFADHLTDDYCRNVIFNRQNIKKNKIVALFPGSREKEILRTGPILLKAAQRLKDMGFTPVISIVKSSVQAKQLKSDAQVSGINIWENDAESLLKQSFMTIAASGTVTLEAAFYLIPMIIIYKIDSLSWLLAKKVLNISYAGLPNWIAEKQIVPELLQDQLTLDNLIYEVQNLIKPANYELQIIELLKVAKSVHVKNAALKVAEAFLKLNEGG